MPWPLKYIANLIQSVSARPVDHGIAMDLFLLKSWYRSPVSYRFQSFTFATAPWTHFGALRSGLVIYMMRRFDLEKHLVAMEKYRISEVLVVPPMAVAILMSPFSKKRPFLKKVLSAAAGAAPLDKDLQVRFRTLLDDNAPFTQVWGMTETSIGTMFHYPEHDDTGSVGRLIPNLEAKSVLVPLHLTVCPLIHNLLYRLIDDDGNNISGYGVRGELCVRGPTITPGYFENPKANAEAFDSEGWFKTGDIAYCDESTGKWYIVDRKKELIKVRAFQVASPELEAVLLSHPQIIDAAVIGVTIPRADSEYPRAYVVRRPGAEGQQLTEDEVKKYVADRLARFKALTGSVKFVDSIAKTASGKILKRVLREDSKRDLKAGLIKVKL